RADLVELGTHVVCGTSPQLGAHTFGDLRQHADIGEHTGVFQYGFEAARAALPVDEGTRFLYGRGHRQHDIGAFGDLAVAYFQTDDEVGGLQRLQRRGRIGQIIGFDAGHDRRGQIAVVQRLDDAV